MKKMREERESIRLLRVIRLGKWGLWGLGFFFSLNINGRAGGYPPDKKHKTRGPPESRIRKIIKSLSVYVYTHEQAAGRMGWAGRFSRVFAHPY
jgi:hypothetical protein